VGSGGCRNEQVGGATSYVASGRSRGERETTVGGRDAFVDRQRAEGALDPRQQRQSPRSLTASGREHPVVKSADGERGDRRRVCTLAEIVELAATDCDHRGGVEQEPVQANGSPASRSSARSSSSRRSSAFSTPPIWPTTSARGT